MSVHGTPHMRVSYSLNQERWNILEAGSIIELGKMYPVGERHVLFFEVKNIGDSILSVSNITINDYLRSSDEYPDGARVSNDGFAFLDYDNYDFSFIRPGEQAVFSIEFTAKRLGYFDASVYVYSSGDSWSVSLKANVESNDIWDHVPLMLVDEDLVFQGGKSFVSEIYGRFEVDTTRENFIIHSVLGPCELYKNSETNSVFMYSEYWGVLRTEIRWRWNLPRDSEILTVWSHYWGGVYFVDLSETREDPFFNDHSSGENEYPEGWNEFIGLPLWDADGFYHKAEELYERLQHESAIVLDPNHDVYGKGRIYDGYSYKEIFDEFLFHCKRTKEAYDFLGPEGHKNHDLPMASIARDTANSLENKGRKLYENLDIIPYQDLKLSEDVYLSIVYIPRGHSQMGSPEGEAGRMPNERLHWITMEQPFAIGKTEITQSQWAEIMGSNPSFRSADSNESYPVNNVSWHEAMEFCRLLTERLISDNVIPEGSVFRLPTEAEWEFAVRFGNGSAWITTNRASSELFNIGPPYVYDPYNIFDANTIPHLDAPAEVMSFSSDRNFIEVYDIHGNVSEWCLDGYLYDYPLPSDAQVKNPVGPLDSNTAVVKGGSWRKGPFDARYARRDGYLKTTKEIDLGFRVVLVFTD